MGFLKKAGGVALCAAMGMGILSGTMCVGTGMLVGYYGNKELDALCHEYEQTEEYSEKRAAEEERLVKLFEQVTEARMDFVDGKITREQLTEAEDAFKVDYEYSADNFTRLCLEETSDPYFQQKLKSCEVKEKVSQGFFYTGCGIYGLKVLLAGASARAALHGKWGQDPVCTTTWLRNGIKYVWDEMVME